MNDQPLPDELAELQQHLSALPADEPSPALRTRVMGNTVAALRRSRRQKTYSQVAAMAVAVLVWANLSLSAVQTVSLRGDVAPDRAAREVVEAQIRELLPEASQRDVTRQAVLLIHGSRLAFCPRPRTGTIGALGLSRAEDPFP